MAHPNGNPRDSSQTILGLSFLLLDLLTACGPSRENRIVVGSKNFTEQLILGELIAQQIENKTHLPVERRFYLAGTLSASRPFSPAASISIPNTPAPP